MHLKNYKLILIILLLPAACSEDKVVYDTGEYKVDLATVQINNDKQAFLLDNNELLLSAGLHKNIEAGQRVMLNYSYLPETSSGYDYVVKINGITAITQSKLAEVNSETINTTANDPVRLESVWIGSHYLNIIFYINYHSKKHSISLITDKAKTHEEEVSIYFRHDNNDDPEGYMRKVIASFDLSDVLGEPVSDRRLLVDINSDKYGSKNCSLIY